MKNETVKAGTKIGAAVGTIAFLAFGIMPGFYFGSYATIIMLQKLVGDALEPTLIVRSVVVMGIVVGILCMAALSIVVGSILGTAMGYLASLPRTLRERKAGSKAQA